MFNFIHDRKYCLHSNIVLVIKLTRMYSGFGGTFCIAKYQEIFNDISIGRKFKSSSVMLHNGTTETLRLLRLQPR